MHHVIIGWNIGLLPVWYLIIIWINADIQAIRPQWRYFSKISIWTKQFLLQKMHKKMSAEWWPCRLGFNVLNTNMCRFGDSFKQKLTFYCFMNFNYKDNTHSWSSFILGIPIPGKNTRSLHWKRAQTLMGSMNDAGRYLIFVLGRHV